MQDNIAFVVDMLKQLRPMAAQARSRSLIYLLDMTIAEAEQQLANIKAAMTVQSSESR